MARVHANRYTFHGDYPYDAPPATRRNDRGLLRHLGRRRGARRLTPIKAGPPHGRRRGPVPPAGELTAAAAPPTTGAARLYLDAADARPTASAPATSSPRARPSAWLHALGAAPASTSTPTFGAILVPRAAVIFKPCRAASSSSWAAAPSARPASTSSSTTTAARPGSRARPQARHQAPAPSRCTRARSRSRSASRRTGWRSSPATRATWRTSSARSTTSPRHDAELRYANSAFPALAARRRRRDPPRVAPGLDALAHVRLRARRIYDPDDAALPQRRAARRTRPSTSPLQGRRPRAAGPPLPRAARHARGAAADQHRRPSRRTHDPPAIGRPHRLGQHQEVRRRLRARRLQRHELPVRLPRDPVAPEPA